MISVEGYVFAGKSTQMELLRQTPRRDCDLILETDLKDASTLPGNGRDLEEAVIFQDWHFAAQIRRYRHAKQCLGTKHVILERGYLSELCYAEAYTQLRGFDLFHYVNRKTAILKDLGLYVVPDVYLIFEIEFDELIRRRPQRVYERADFVLPDFWFDRGFKAAYERRLKEHLRTVEPETSQYKVNGEAPITALEADIHAILDECFATV